MPSLTVRWLALVLALLAALYLCWLMLQPFVDVLLWALVLVVVFMPVHRRILARSGSPTTSVVLSTLLVVVTILVPASFVTVAVVGELTQLAGSLSSGEAQVWKVQPIIDRITAWIGPWVDLQQFQSKDFLLERHGQLNIIPALDICFGNLARRLRARVPGGEQEGNKSQNTKVRTSHLCLASV